jgi:TonB family protein
MSSVNELRSSSLSIEWIPGHRVRIVSDTQSGEAALVARCAASALVAALTIPAAQFVEHSPLPATTTILLSTALGLFVFFVKYLRSERAREAVLDWESRRVTVITHLRLGRKVKRFGFDALQEVLLRTSAHRRGKSVFYSCTLKLRLPKGGHEILGTRGYLSAEAACAAILPAARELSAMLPAPLREVTDGDTRPAAVDLPTPPPEGRHLAGQVISRFNPVPPRALDGSDGPVTVEVTVSEHGRVTSAVALSGNPSLHDAALSAAREWIFVPTRVSGTPVKVRGTITIEFGLSAAHSRA